MKERWKTGLSFNLALTTPFFFACKTLVRERSLTIGGGESGKFGGRAAIFWTPIKGGLKFSGPAFRGGLQVLGAFGRCARTILNGFCATEILSTA